MIIVDASIAIKWLNQAEEGSSEALVLYKKHIEKQETILFPQLLLIEVANYLATKTNTSEKNIKDGLQLLFQSHFAIHQPTEEEVIEASVLAKAYHTTAYDMLYAIIAKRKQCVLVTADEKFVLKVTFPFVKTLTTYASLEPAQAE